MKLEVALTVENGKLVPFGFIMSEYIYSEIKEGDIISGELTINNRKGAATNLQKASLHLWFGKIAKYCNAAGIVLTSIMPKKMEVPVTNENFKYAIWQPCLYAMYNEISTTKIDTVQLSDCAKEIDARLLMPNGVDVPFPSQESLMYESINEQQQDR